MLAPSLLLKLSHDERLPAESRRALQWSAEVSGRARYGKVASRGSGIPKVILFDCGGNEDLPGAPVDTSTSTDTCVGRVNDTTHSLLDFWKSVLNRNSIDDAGCDVRSSVHYSRGYCNAAWTDGEMIYGDGDGYLFTDFTRSNDFIGHELMHGVTASVAGLGYQDEYGALNESLSDVFGSLFKQWSAKQSASVASWRIGAELIAPPAQAHGWICVRDMASPASPHCVSPQALNYSQYHDGGDPHEFSGIPSLAFYTAAIAIGGYAWEKAGRVWYETLRAPKVGSTPTFARFAHETVAQAGRLFPHDPAVAKAIADAWTSVGVAA